MIDISMLTKYTAIKSLLLILFGLCSSYASASFTKLTNFGANPGELTASYYAKDNKQSNLVVLLHGCVQSGEELAKQSGLLGLAKTHNFTLLVPQQSQNNNIKSCFNWFSEQDTNKDSGETLSIINMIKALKNEQASQHVYVVGLSAGGAMASSLLVHYPTLFEAGAVVAGIPYPCADNLIKAISCMRVGPSQSVPTLVQEITAHNDSGEPVNKTWPRLSVWTGTADKVVHPLNAERLANSWAILSALQVQPEIKKQAGYQLSQWKNGQNKVQVELIELENIGHGLAVNSKVKNGGTPADFLLESPLSAAANIIEFWQIN